ncbi:MAG TPA: HD domain-containing phosphohydrolase [Clostridia bacterium]|nr:HD domain-containing phosphohydrolase [Clostridia bacterium]
MSHKNGNEFFIIKQVNGLLSGDIVLHPIYRSDGLMLIKQYKVISNDLAQKIKYLVPGVLPVIVLSPECNIETFNNTHSYNNTALIKELKKIRKEHSEYIQVPLEISAFVDARINIKNSIIAADEIENTEDNYISFLCKSPFFSTFEKRLESSHLQTRAKKIKEILADTILKNRIMLDKLNELKEYKDIALLHSINTTSIALMLGITLELPEEELIDLALANLLIDISITQIPKEEFDLHLQSKKPNRDFYNLHLNQLRILSQELPLIRKESIIYGVLDSYESYDGSGYPKGKKRSEISLFGRIISIAQAYDEMVGGYFYNNGLKPIQALQSIWENRGTRFDPDIIRILIDRTNILKSGQHIIYSSIYQGMIMGFTDFINSPVSPIIKLENGNIVDLLSPGTK